MGGALAQGEHVYLRHPGARDREEFLEAVRRSRRLHGSWVEPPGDDEAFAAYLHRLRQANAHGFLVRTNDDGSLAGAITISQIVLGPFRSGYLGYYAFEPHAGRGLMREGLDLTVRYAFGTLGLHRLEANVQPGNAASIATRAPVRLPPRGALAPVPEGRRPLARPRAMGGDGRGSAQDLGPTTPRVSPERPLRCACGAARLATWSPGSSARPSIRCRRSRRGRPC